MAIGRRRRFRNPRGGSGLAKVLPYLAIGGLLYLMAKNAPAAKGATSTTTVGPAAGSVGNNCGGTDFGTSGGCWCG
jgi:hypothetical protein